MKIFVNTDTTVFQDTASTGSFSGISFKRASQQIIQIQFISAGVAYLLPTGTLVELAIKKPGDYDGSFLSAIIGFTAPGSSSGYYTAILDTNTTQIDTYIGENDSVPAILEVTWLPPGQTLPNRSVTGQVQIFNRVITGEEGPPTDADIPPGVLTTACFRTTTLPNAVNTGWVGYSDLGLTTAAPSYIAVLEVTKANPEDADLWGAFVNSEIGATSAAFELQGATDNANRKLKWIVFA